MLHFQYISLLVWVDHYVNFIHWQGFRTWLPVCWELVRQCPHILAISVTLLYRKAVRTTVCQLGQTIVTSDLVLLPRWLLSSMDAADDVKCHRMNLQRCCYVAWKDVETRAEIEWDHAAESWNGPKYVRLRSDTNKQGHTHLNMNSGMSSAPIIPL